MYCCLIETSVPPRKCAVTFSNLRKIFKKPLSSLLNNFGKSSQVFGKRWEIFGKSSET